MSTRYRVCIIAPILVMVVLISGCLDGDRTITPVDSVMVPGRGFFLGVLPIPGSGQSFQEAYQQASLHAEFSPVWGRPSPYYRLPKDLDGEWGEKFVEVFLRGNGMFPLLHLSFIGPELSLVAPPEMDSPTLVDKSWRDSYKQATIDAVRTSKPQYLSLGNEVNRWYWKYGAEKGDPNGFQHYVSLYEEIYDTVKEISPETKVFCTFAREIVSENEEADLEVLRMFDPGKLDILVLTSYPFAVEGVNRPSDIPADYYLKASDYMPGKLFGFSELGWPSSESFGGQQAQADFIIQVSTNLTRERGIPLHLFCWAWLHDLDKKDQIGLLGREGTEKLAYEVWKDLSLSG